MVRTVGRASLRLCAAAFLLWQNAAAAPPDACLKQALEAARQTVEPAWPASDRLALQKALRVARDGQALHVPRVTQEWLSPPAAGFLHPVSLPDLRGEQEVTELAGSWAIGKVNAYTADPVAPTDFETLITAVQAASDDARRAFARVLPDDRAGLLAALPALLDRVSDGSDLQSAGLSDRVLRIAAETDFDALNLTLRRLLAMTDPALLERLRGRFAAAEPIERPAWLSPAFEGEFLFAERLEQGLVLVGGRGPNRYGGPAVLILDLGGDDAYANDARVILDLAGDDRYAGYGEGGPGAGIFDVGMIVDAAGDDRYVGQRVAQGSGVFGIGVLWDLEGDDVYAARELAQGASLFGAGLLVDVAGSDRYVAAKFAQGFGGANGLGLLVDFRGDDDYRAGGKHPSSYGTPEVYQAFSQGVGMGFRTDVGGGLGALVDHAGDDRYHAGNFAQGTGYYLGTGLLLDQRGDDRYIGSRYSQAAAAHLGVGLLVDVEGDDVYLSRLAANQAGAWDLSVAVLADCGGNDHYAAGDLALGSAAQNAAALFYDGSGTDTYAIRGNGFGHPGAATYGGGRSAGNLGVFIDRGAEQDRYPHRFVTRPPGGTRGNLGLYRGR